MTTPAAQNRFLQPSRDGRRRLLSQHFIAAVEPLLERGERYSNLTVERLLTEVKVARSTFYAHFDDKGDLLAAMAENIQNDLFASGQSWWTFPSTGDKQALREALAPSFQVHRANQGIMAALAEAAAYDDGVRDRYLALIAMIIDNLEQHIRQAQHDRSACPDLDPRHTTQWLVWMLESGLHLVVGPATDAQIGGIHDAATDIIWRTLYQGYR